jgi:opacity protein-like surface antigen
MKKTIAMLALAAAILTTAGLASADGYSQGTVSIAPSGGAYALLNKNTTSLVTYGLDLGYFVVDGLELGVRGQGVYLTTQFSDPFSGSNNSEHFNGGGGEGFARWHFYQFDNNAGSVFAEVGAGVLWFTDTVTKWNSGSQFSGLAGLGVSYALGQHVNLVVSANYRHIGSFDSTGIDGLGGVLGLKFTF